MRFLVIMTALSTVWSAGWPMVVPLAYGEGRLIPRSYAEVKYDETINVSWALYECTGYRLVYEKGPEIHITETDEEFSATSWSMTDTVADCSLIAVRRGHMLSIAGSCRGDVVNKDIELDDAPWFQASSLSLSRFVRSRQEEVVFWTLRPGSFAAVKLRAVKVGRQAIVIAGHAIDTVKLQLRAVGWRAPFWKSFYWFRAGDGAFVKFEGPADASGSGTVVITLTGEQPIEACDCP